MNRFAPLARRIVATSVVLACAALPLRALAAPSPCTGDCDGSGDVTVDEIVTMVFIALGGAAVSTCTAGDADGGTSITVDEIITASTKALDGCGLTPTPSDVPTATLTPGETATLTHTPATTATEDATTEPEGTETPAPTASAPTPPLETETPEPTTTNGMMPMTRSPAPTTAVPSQTVLPTVTKTASPVPTTPAALPTQTPFVVPTQTPAPLPTHTSGSGARLDIGSAAGAPGSTVAVVVVLSGGNAVLTATSNDIVYDGNRVRPVQDGGAACTISPAIGPGSPINKMLLASVAPTTGTLERLRVGVISFANANVIPDGPLFTCRFEIAANAPAGSVVLQNVPSASNVMGDPIPVSGSHGTIVVQ